MATIEDLASLRQCQIEDIQEVWTVLDIVTSSLASLAPEFILMDNEMLSISNEPVLAAQNTLVSIDFCCQKNFFADAFSLTRKYRDDLMMHLYLHLVTSEIAKSSTKEEALNADINSDTFLEIIMNHIEIKKRNDSIDEEKNIIFKWARGDYIKAENKKSKDEVKGKFKIGNYKSRIVNASTESEYGEKIACAFKYLQESWNSINEKLNDYTHTNALSCIKANGLIGEKNSQLKRMELVDTLRKITFIFLCMLAMIQPVALSSNDYVFFLEEYGFPKDGLQYLVASGVTDFLQKYAKDISVEALMYISNENCYGMKIVD